MEGWIKSIETPPPLNVNVDIMYSGRIIQSSWDGAVWALDPSGQVMPMYWRLNSAE